MDLITSGLLQNPPRLIQQGLDHFAKQNPPLTSPSPPPTKNMDLITSGLLQNSPPLIQQGLDHFAASRRGLTPALQDRVLGLAVKRGKPDIVKFLIDEAGCEVERLRPWFVGVAVMEGGVEDVRGVLEVLVARGWDVNGGGGDSPDPRYPEYLIYQVCSSSTLVRWCLTHGALVAYPDVESYTPLLDHVAKSSPSPSAAAEKMAVFKLLLDHGAKLGRRTLHIAACSAAAGGANRVEIRERNMELVRYLVEEMGCDVNGMDVPDGERYGNHYGTPINYIAHGSGGEETVVRYLLEKGANPEIKDCWDTCDAFGYAKLGNKKVLEILNQWKQENKN